MRSGDRNIHGCWKAALAASLALALAACGGGGGGQVRDTPPPATTPPTTPPAPPPATPPTTPQPAFDAHLSLTNALAAQSQGFTGAGYRIGVIDSGVNRYHPALDGRVVASYAYLDPSRNNLGVDDVVGHGTTVAQLAAGKAVGSWPGGIAPGAQIVSARIIADESPEDDGSGQGNEVSGALGLQQVHDDLIAQGVRIMNNSWGGLYWTNPAATAAIAGEYRSFIFGNDGLVVFAAGNESNANPSDMAALPSQPGPGGTRPAADLERGWLTVAALDTATPTQLASYSNACGVAMHYCLVAPGTSVFTGPDDVAGSTTYYYGSGTSYAAPLVSGAAALVWQAFPYFNNDLVRQTLLGTATDLGDPGVDAVFGHGLLNIGKAVQGPARFDWGDVAVSFAGSSTWANDIGGSGGLVKDGSGTLVLSGTGNHYSGDTTVLGGTLRVASLDGSRVAIGSAGTLVGAGPISGNVTNAGTFEVGTDVLSLQGDYLQSGGRLALNVGDRLSVSGSATLQGGDLHVLGKRDYVGLDVAYTVLEAANGLSGTFAGVSSPANVFVQASLDYDGNSASITLQRLDVTAAAAALGDIGAAALASATRIENAFRLIDGQTVQGEGSIGDGFIRGAAAIQQSPDAAAAAATLRSLSGQAHVAAAAMTFDSIDMSRRALSSRLESVLAAPRRQGAWQASLGGQGRGGFSASEVPLSGWLMGHDQWLGEGRIGGLAFGQTRLDGMAGMDFARGHDRQTQVQGYLGWLHGNAYALGQLGAGQFQRRLDRGLLLGQQLSGVSSQYRGSLLSGSVEAGYRWGGAALAFTPYAGAEYAQVRSDGFRESGGEGFGLQADAATSSRLQALAGVRGDWSRGMLTLRGHAEWQQVLSAAGLQRQARFVGVDAWAPLDGTAMQRSGGLFGLGVDAALSRQGRLSLGYDQRFGPRGALHAWSAQYLLRF